LPVAAVKPRKTLGGSAAAVARTDTVDFDRQGTGEHNDGRWYLDPMHAAEARQRRRVVVSGLVHNVWYRDSCRSEAVARGVTGWVRNRSDGAVEAVFEGSRETVEQMISWCRVGPPLAHIDDVEVSEEVVRGEVGFLIR
jgi:acylphosphatase